MRGERADGKAVFVEGHEFQPWDICACGDYRADHEDGVGRCRFDHHDPPPRKCRAFKFAWRSDDDRARYVAAVKEGDRP